MSAPGSPSSSRHNSPLPFRHEYLSSYNDHFGGSTPRPSSAPPSTSRRDISSSAHSPSSSPSPSRRAPTHDILNPSPLPSSSFHSSRHDVALAPASPRASSPSSFSSPSASFSTPPARFVSPPTRFSASPARTYASPSEFLAPSTPPDVSESPTARYAKYSWNKGRNPLLDGDESRASSGRKQVPQYFDNLEKFDEDTKRLSRKSRPEPTPFLIDPSRAGIPTLIQRIRTHEEDIYLPKRPSTAPESSPMARDEDIPAAGTTTRANPTRRPCQIEKFNVRRNPLLEGGENLPPRRQVIAFNKESDTELQLGRKTTIIPPSLMNVTRTTEYFIPGEHPPAPSIRLRLNHPDDSDIFNQSHPLVSPTAAHLMGAIEKEQARDVQEKELDKAYQERVSFYNDEIKKFKAKAKLKSGGM